MICSYKKILTILLKPLTKINTIRSIFLNGWPTWCSQICGAKPNIDAKSFSVVATELVDKYIYVRNRGALYETETYTFVDKENFNDYWATFLKEKKNLCLKFIRRRKNG